ncbi:MAG: MarR family transcriptional regulator [Pseudomonadota bacterium]
MPVDHLEQLKLEASEQLLRLTNKMLWGRKHPRDYGTGELLYMSEVEVIIEVGQHPEINLTELSEILGVTKATLSPIVNKLEKKAYLSKRQTLENAKVKRLVLKAKGRKALEGLAAYGAKLQEYMDDVTERELKSYMRLLGKVEMFVDDVDHEIRKK